MARHAARLTYRDLKLALLATLDREGPLARQVLVGGQRRPGLVDIAFERPLPSRERVRVEEALDLLQRDGLVMESDSGFQLTERGSEALARSCLDPLDLALHRENPRLVERRASAWAAVAAGSADALRAAATAPGEIVAACLERLESEDDLDDIGECAADLALALDRRISERAQADEAPEAQDLADAIRVAEIVVRRTLLARWR